MALEIFKLVGSIFVDSDKANESISKTDQKAEGLAKKMLSGVGTAAKWGAGIATAAGTVAAAVGGIAMSAAGTADEIDKMSQKIGLSKEGYQEWSYIMGQNGMEIDKMQVGMKTMTALMDSAAGGTASAVEKFEQLGVSIYDSNGKLRDQESVMEETLIALADMENGTEKARLATELFGKSGSEMMPMLNQGSKAMLDLKSRAHELGLVMSDDAVNAGVVLGDTIDDIKQSAAMIGTKLGSAVIPIIQQFADLIIQNMPMIQSAITALAPVLTGLMDEMMPQIMELAQLLLPVIIDLINTIVPIFTQIVSMILPVLVELLDMLLPPIIQIIQAVLPVLVTLLDAIMPILQLLIDLLTPIIQLFVDLIAPIISLIAEALAPLIEIIGILIVEQLRPLTEAITIVGNIFGSVLQGVLETATVVVENIIGVFQEITTFLKGVFTGDFKIAFQGLTDIVKNIFGGIVEFVKMPINTIIDLINGFIDGVNSLEIPDWVPGVGGQTLNLEHIKKLKSGGLTGSGTLISTNENEPEIVGNYGTRTLVVNNAQIIDTMVGAISQTMERYIDKMADMLIQNGEGMSGDICIPIYIGNEMIDEVIVGAKERVTKRSGGRAYV